MISYKEVRLVRRGRRRNLRLGAALLGTAVLVGIAWSSAVGYLAMVVALLVLVALSERCRAHVGDDGICFERPFERDEYVGFSSMASTTAETFWLLPAITIALRGGGEMHLAWNRGTSVQLAARDELRARVAAAIATAGAEPAQMGDAFTRGSASASEWISRIRSMLGDAGYRGTAPEVLWSLVADAAARPTTRAGAAVALEPTLDAEGRARIRVAAESCAEPRLRVALEAIAEGAADDAVERALGRVVDDA